MQTLAEAQETLKRVIQERVQDAIHKQEHDTVVRFVKLYAPLRMKVNDTVFAVCNQVLHIHAPYAMSQKYACSPAQWSQVDSVACRTKVKRSSLRTCATSLQSVLVKSTVLWWKAQVLTLSQSTN